MILWIVLVDYILFAYVFNFFFEISSNVGVSVNAGGFIDLLA